MTREEIRARLRDLAGVRPQRSTDNLAPLAKSGRPAGLRGRDRHRRARRGHGAGRARRARCPCVAAAPRANASAARSRSSLERVKARWPTMEDADARRVAARLRSVLEPPEVIVAELADRRVLHLREQRRPRLFRAVPRAGHLGDLRHPRGGGRVAAVRGRRRKRGPASVRRRGRAVRMSRTLPAPVHATRGGRLSIGADLDR